MVTRTQGIAENLIDGSLICGFPGFVHTGMKLTSVGYGVMGYFTARRKKMDYPR